MVRRSSRARRRSPEHETKQCFAPSSSGISLQATARSASGSRSFQSSSTSDPRRRSRMPPLRRRRKRLIAARLGQQVERRAAQVDDLLERRAPVRRPERDDVADAAAPSRAALGRLVRGAARDEAAHRVPDERDLADLDRPVGDASRSSRSDSGGRSRRSGGRCCSGRTRASSRTRRRAGCRSSARAPTRTRSPSGRGGRRPLAGRRRSLDADGRAVDADRHRLRSSFRSASSVSPISPLTIAMTAAPRGVSEMSCVYLRARSPPRPRARRARVACPRPP